MSLRTLAITLNNISRNYSPGETISGEVIIDSNGAANYRGLQLKFNGAAVVHWTERNPRRNREQNNGGNYRIENEPSDVHYHAEEEYFQASMYVLGGPAGNVHVGAGRLVVPFTTPLPMNIPSSFADINLGRIEYSIEASMSTAWGSEFKTKILFYVNAPPNLSQYPCEPIVDVVNKKYYCCLLPCITNGSMDACIRSLGNCYSIGEWIHVFLDIDSHSKSVQVTSVDMKLEQRTTFQAHAPENKTKSNTKTIAMTKSEGPFPDTATLELKIKIPSVPHSGFENCGIIAVKYLLKIEICVSGCHLNIKKEHDIIIGSRPQLLEHQIAPTAPLIGIVDSSSSTFVSPETLRPQKSSGQFPVVNVPYGPANVPYGPANVPYTSTQPPCYEAAVMQGYMPSMHQ